MARKNRDLEELKKVSDHVFYEMWMFASISRLLSLNVTGPGALNNALLESFTIHARGLFGFFYAQAPRADDVIAEDYFTNPEGWHSVRPQESKELQVAHNRVNKEVAHLTYARLEVIPDEKEWKFMKMNQEMAEVMKCFLNAVSVDKLGNKLRSQKEMQNVK